MKIIIGKLSISIIFLTILASCSREDFDYCRLTGYKIFSMNVSDGCDYSQFIKDSENLLEDISQDILSQKSTQENK